MLIFSSNGHIIIKPYRFYLIAIDFLICFDYSVAKDFNQFILIACNEHYFTVLYKHQESTSSNWINPTFYNKNSMNVCFVLFESLAHSPWTTLRQLCAGVNSGWTLNAQIGTHRVFLSELGMRVHLR